MEQTLLNEIVARVAAKLAEEYWDEHRQDILYIVDGSFLEEYDEYNIEVQFKSGDERHLPGHAEVREAEGAVPCGLRFPPE